MYNNITSQPENISVSINLELTYEQAIDDGNDGITIPPTINRRNNLIYNP